MRWLRVNFSDSFIAWIHVKVITSARTNAGIIFTVVKTLEENPFPPTLACRAVSSYLFTRTVFPPPKFSSYEAQESLLAGYSLGNATVSPNTYPMDSDLSSG